MPTGFVGGSGECSAGSRFVPARMGGRMTLNVRACEVDIVSVLLEDAFADSEISTGREGKYGAVAKVLQISLEDETILGVLFLK